MTQADGVAVRDEDAFDVDAVSRWLARGRFGRRASRGDAGGQAVPGRRVEPDVPAAVPDA